MCLAVPAKVVAIRDALAQVDYAGVRRDVSLLLLPEAKIGDYVLVHAGFAMQIVEEKDAAETEALLAEMAGAPRTVELSLSVAGDSPRPFEASPSGRGAGAERWGAYPKEANTEGGSSIG